ncbi:HNH endonuclease [Propionibacterium phage PaP11-13]|nr:HNH endonuclease [Propionibacterium phage PaP11-13]
MFGCVLLPLLLLHVLQMICPLSRVLSPPLLTGVMWSASGLVDRSCVSQARVAPQSGHSVWPCCLAWVMSRCRQRRCAADAVRLVCAIASPVHLWSL